MSLSRTRRRLPGRRTAAAAAATAFVALPVLLAPAAATAKPVSLSLQYTCTFPLMDPQPLTLQISSDIPESLPIGTAAGRFAVSAEAKVNDFAAHGLRALDSATIQGTAVAGATIVFPGGNTFEAVVNTDVPKMSIPSSGGFTTSATGKTPSLTFDDPGNTELRVNDLVLSLEPRLADGTLTGLDKFETECTRVPGQNNLLATIKVTDDSDPGPDTQAPSKPSGLSAVAGDTSIALSWTPSTDNVAVAGYDVFRGGTKVASVTTPTATISGLTPNTDYSFTVQARDAAGNTSPISDALASRTIGGTSGSTYAIAGTATLKTLTKGTIALTGTANAAFAANGDVSADLVVNPGNAKLTALGFLPVSAKVAFVPSGKTTGTLVGTVLSTTSRVRIKIPEVRLFGAIPLAGGNNCQTKSLSTINLKSNAAGFTKAAGGTVAGTFTISDLNGCGGLNGLVSPLTAGSGNTLSLKLTPKPTA